MNAEGECPVPVGGPAGADDTGAGCTGELYGDRADAARGAVDQDGLARREAAVVEQALPGGQSGDGKGCGERVVDVRREGASMSFVKRVEGSSVRRRFRRGAWRTGR
nr:hypothetical protein StreXyl84_61470 [Streptomyces sp. Xyl84]